MHENRETSETPTAKPGRRSAGEGKSHTARAYVFEESHSGIVPMNHSNKDGEPSAESAEAALNQLSAAPAQQQPSPASAPKSAQLSISSAQHQLSSASPHANNNTQQLFFLHPE